MQGDGVSFDAQSLPLGPGVVVVSQHPAGLFAVAKPTGVMSHPNDRSKEEVERSLLQCRYDEKRECYLVEGKTPVFLLHRLDSATSGVILLATEEKLAEAIKEKFAGREVEKTYWALVFGAPLGKEQLWQDRMTVRRVGGKLRSEVGPVGEKVSCGMKILGTYQTRPVTSLLELRPHTGRSHQLRVQCRSRQLPIVGDATYGDFARNKSFTKETGGNRLMLHALEVKLELSWKGKKEKFVAKAAAPAEFKVGGGRGTF